MGQEAGVFTYEIWDGIGGTAVADLTGDPNFPDNPTSVEEGLTLFETPTNRADNFGGRLSGWIQPEISGDYTFWLAADDGAEVWLSTTAEPADAVMIVAEDSWGGSRDWFDRGQSSDPVALVAGEVYYIEGLYKEGGGGDNLAVGWSLGADVVVVPTPIPLEAGLVGPADGAVDMPVEALLEWTPGPTALMNKVFLSTDAIIDEADLIAETPEASVDPELEPGVTYYWRVDGVDMDGDHVGNVWSFTVIPIEAHFPSPAAGAVWQPADSVLSWTPGLGALVHNVFFSTDAALVEAKDPSVQVGQWLSDATFDPGALDPATTYYWAVDEFLGASTNPGPVWSFTTVDPDIDMNVNNWAAVAGSAAPAYQAVHVADGVYDIGELSGDITYEFIVISDPCETEASMALIGRRSYGDTAAGLKYEQWNNTGTYGATLFGVVDLDFGVPTAPGEYTHLAFVSKDDPNAPTTTLYVNGEEAGVVNNAITLNGIVGIGYAASAEDGSASFDNFDGSVFGVAIYDEALSAEVIEKNATAFLSPIAISDPDLLIHYTFETGSGPIVIDQSGHGNSAEFFGTPEWTTGISGGGLALASDDGDYIETKAPLGITTNTLTVCGWAIHDESPAAWSGILTHRGDGAANFGLQHNGTELRYMWSTNIYWGVSTGLEMPNGEWYFSAISVAPDQATIHLNDATFTHVNEHIPTSFNGPISIGRDVGYTSGRFMTATLDDVRLYNKTLNDAEVVAVMLGLSDVTGPDDVVVGVPDEARDGSVAGWPGNEPPAAAVDDDTATKFLHFKGEVEATGFKVTPAIGRTLVTGLTFTSANDAEPRDPVTFELSGSNESIDGPYELIASGDIADFAQADPIARFTKTGTPIIFENDAVYTHYQVMFPTVRDAGNANSMQIAEVELLGVSMATDIAISTKAGWWGQDAADREAQEIVDNVTAVAVEQFTADQEDALADWVIAHTGNGVADLLILCGQLPESIYPGGNAQPDGSLAESFLDDGNTIINTGDYIFYVGTGSNNATGGLENMMDLPGVSMWGDGTPCVPTAEALEITPSLVEIPSTRPFFFDQLVGDWYPELVLGQTADGAVGDPVIVRNSATGGRLGIFFQVADALTDIRGEVISEWINNWYLDAGR